MKNNWQKFKLGDVCELIAGFAFKSKDFGGYPDKVVKITNIEPPFVNMTNLVGVDFSKYNRNNLTKFIVKRRDYVLAMTGATIGKLGRIYDDRIAYINQRVLKFKPNDDVDKDFLFFILSESKFSQYILNHIDSESAQANISAKTIGQYEFELPPLETQKKISAILGSLDNKIELNEKINQNLEQQAQALFKSWFVDFEPFGGKMPEDWKVGKLGDIAKITSGKRPQVKQDNMDFNFSVPLVGASCVMGYTNQALYRERILITGRVGTHGIIQRFYDCCWPSDNTLVILSKYYEYVYQSLKTINYTSMNRGSTQPLITQTDLKNREIIIPSSDKLIKFEQISGQLMKKYEFNQKENEKLAQLRDALLPKLMSGEIDVSNVNIDDLASADKLSFTKE